jgi:zinc/manganese transport system substrate-binding protein
LSLCAALGVYHAALVAAPPAPLHVVTTTADLASLAREVGGDRIEVTALANPTQDPHQVDPKPSFILQVNRADLLIAVGRELEIGWLPPLTTSARNAKVQPGGPGYLDASANVKILEIPTGRSRARWAMFIRREIRTTGSIPRTGASSRGRSRTSL